MTTEPRPLNDFEKLTAAKAKLAEEFFAVLPDLVLELGAVWAVMVALFVLMRFFG